MILFTYLLAYLLIYMDESVTVVIDDFTYLLTYLDNSVTVVIDEISQLTT